MRKMVKAVRFAKVGVERSSGGCAEVGVKAFEVAQRTAAVGVRSRMSGEAEVERGRCKRRSEVEKCGEW